MIKNTMIKIQNVLLLSVLPFLAGCIGGGGGGDGTSFMGAISNQNFQEALPSGINPSGGIEINSFGGGVEEEILAQIHNPEPATMLLLGGGVIAMRFLKNRK